MNGMLPDAAQPNLTTTAPDRTAGPVRRRRWPWVAVALILVGAIGGSMWARAPLHRTHVLLRVPIRLADGERVAGRFTPEHDGAYELAICFPRTRPLEELAALVGGDWGLQPGPQPPAGISVSYTIRDGGASPRRGVANETYDGGRYAADEVCVVLGFVKDGRKSPSEIEARVEHAVPGLAGVEATFVVAAAGDWVNMASIESMLRQFVVGLGTALFLGGVAITSWMQTRRASLRDRKTQS